MSKVEAEAPFAGQTVVVTGVVQGLKRWEVDAEIMNAGGVAADKVTATTTLLVVGDKPGQTKLQAGARFLVPIITEAEFRRRIGR